MQDIYIDDQGNGFPLVLVHGFLGSSEMWSLQKEFLSKHFKVISPALPGFGESHKVKSKDSINKMAQTILKNLNERNIEKFHLLGHSIQPNATQNNLRLIHLDRRWEMKP